MGILHGLRVAERAGQPHVLAVDVERLLLRPQSPDDREGLVQGGHRVPLVVEGQAVALVLAAGQRVVGPRADADTEVEAASSSGPAAAQASTWCR